MKGKFYCILIVLFLSHTYLSAQIVRIESIQFSEDSSHWQGLVDLNIYSIKNNSKFFRFSSGSQVKYSKLKNTLLSLNELRLIFAGQNDLENKGFQHLRYQREIDSVFTLEVFSQIQFDQILKIKLRVLNGIGPRIQLLKRTKTKFYFGSLYMYEYEEENETGIINRDHRLSAYGTIARKMKKSSFQFITYYQPRLDNFSDYRISGSATFTIELIKQLLFNISGELAYDSNPVAGVTSLNYTFINGFSLKF